MTAMETGVSTAALDPGAADRFHRLRQQLGVTTFGLNQILLRPGERGRIHAHERQEEVYLVVEGTLTLVVEGEPQELGRGELARVAPTVRRQLVNRHPEPLLLLAVGGAEPHEGRDGRAWTAWEEPAGAARPPQDVPFPADVPVQG
jgi:mannose-6-phosphate isomerase-like protein (cupin superfamily)